MNFKQNNCHKYIIFNQGPMQNSNQFNHSTEDYEFSTPAPQLCISLPNHFIYSNRDLEDDLIYEDYSQGQMSGIWEPQQYLNKPDPQAIFEQSNQSGQISRWINIQESMSLSSHIPIKGIPKEKEKVIQAQAGYADQAEQGQEENDNKQSKINVINQQCDNKIDKKVRNKKAFWLKQKDFKKCKKNVNMPKAILKHLVKYYNEYKLDFEHHNKAAFLRFEKKLEELNVWTKKSKLNVITLDHFQQIFCDYEENMIESKLKRLMMRKVAIKYFRKEIQFNNQIKDKLEYLITAKVYALRCSNSILTTRMKFR